jgi:hypothetical protein
MMLRDSTASGRFTGTGWDTTTVCAGGPSKSSGWLKRQPRPAMIANARPSSTKRSAFINATCESGGHLNEPSMIGKGHASTFTARRNLVSARLVLYPASRAIGSPMTAYVEMYRRVGQRTT